MPMRRIAMLMVSQSGPSMDRRYLSLMSYQARVHQRRPFRVPAHQSCQAERDELLADSMEGTAEC